MVAGACSLQFFEKWVPPKLLGFTMAYAPLGLGSMLRRQEAFTWKVLTSAMEAWFMKLALFVQVVQQLCSKHWKNMGFGEYFLKLKEQSETHS